MEILMLLLANWDSVLILLAAGAGVVTLIVKRQYDILDTIIFSLVTRAEKEYGSGTGTAKLAAVIEWVYPKIPSVIRLFITANRLEQLINRVLIKAKEKWVNNPKLAAYIGSDGN